MEAVLPHGDVVSVFWSGSAALHRVDDLAPNLPADGRVRSRPNDIQQRVLLLLVDVRSVPAVKSASSVMHDWFSFGSPLNKDEQALMPQDRELVLACTASGRVGEPDKVEDKRVNHLVRQGVLLVQQDPDEQRVGARVVHARESE